MPEMTQSGSPNKSKHRKKNRESHNEVERHRKKKINSGINRIGDLIPCSPALKQSKNMILDQAFKYITELKRQNDELLLNGGDKEQACEIKKLRRELTDIQKENARYIELLKSNDICLYDDPTLHWKGNARSLKASLIVPADQVQKLPLCLSSNQLGSANQGTAVHGITFNVGHNLQKQTANVVPVQRTCNLVTPITISGVFPLDKSWQQNSTSASTSSQHAALSLPVTTLAPSTADFIVCKDDQIVQLPSSSTSHISFLSSSAAPLNCSSNQLAQPENKVECSGRKHVDIVPKAAVSTCDKLPFHGSPSSVPGINLHGSPNLVQGKLPGVTACVETVKDVVKEMLPSVEISSSPGVAVTSGEINSSVEVQAGSAVSVLCAPSLEPSWSISSSLPELKSVGSLTRIPSDGTTQTTWSTLQLAGNTVQPLSLLSSAIVPSPLTEQSTASKDTLNSPQVTACINLNGVASSKVNPVEKVIVKMSSYQPVPVQSLITQPQLQSTTNILPLNPPVQVIQVAQPFGAAINSAPANQNIIFLQPPAPAPCPPVPKPAIGQQIVIIQTTPNQNPVPLMSAQPSSSVVMPINAANSTACPTNPVQNTMVPQTFSGKHLVHILPRPPSVQPSSNAQQVPVSAATSSQQPPTISLNGQLFALQPMTPSAGTSNQTPMQIIQPIASEDPNTNVALNTFGALANLSQNISQMAGQSCLQLTLNTPAATSLASNNMQVNCVSVAGSNVTPATTETSSVLPIASVLAKSLSVKPIGGTPPSAKPKNTTKKSGVKKGASVRKDSTAITKSDSLCLDVPKPQSSDRNTRPIKSAAQEKMVASVDSSPKNGVSDKTQETSTSTALNASLVANLTESMPEEPLSADIVYGSRDLIADEVCITQEDEQRPPSSAPECFKASIESRAAPFNNQSVQHTLVVEVPQDQIGLSTDENSDTTMVSRSCLIEGDPASLIAADLLAVQVLTDEPYGKSPPEKATAKDLDRHGILSRKVKSKESVSSEEPKLNSSVVQVAQNQTSNSEQEVVNSSCVTGRQTDSPLSNSSVSSRNFSVASMLPDTSREDIVSGVSLVPPLNGCGFSEQNDIVAVAARAIFEQESLPKGRSRTQAEVGATVSRNVQSETLAADSPLPFKPHSAKENISQLSSTSDSFNTLDTKDHHCADRSVDKSNCPLGVNAASLSLQISTSQSQNMTSLSINNLLHQGGITHSVLNCASVLQTSEHIPLPTSTNPSVSSSAYESQTQVTTVLSEYSHEQLHSMNSTVMQVTQTTDSLLKQHADGRKESNKRAAHVDGLLSTAKRQKQCQAPIRLERLQTPDSVAEQNEMLVSHVSSDSSSISGNIQGHREGISNLFPTNNFVNSNLRQTDMRCGSQPSISEQGQMTNQHLQPLQQHQQQQLPLHNSNPYLKQQQSGHLRDQHHLYQQQHQVPHVDSSVRSQPHNIQQQRMMQHDVQMQKKRAPVQGAQVSRMTLQQKHLSEQHRQKSAQPHRQQIQQQLPPHFGSTQPEKTCDNNPPSRGLHGTHPQSHVGQDIRHQQEMNSRPQGPIVSSEHLSGHNQVQRLMTSRSLEQQMVSQSSAVSRPSNMTCAPHRQERNRVSSYSAEALIGKSTSNSEQRLGISIQASRVSEQLEMRNYLDISRNKVIPAHNIQGRMPVEHVVNMDSQRLPDCQTFKIGGLNHQQTANFEVQTSRNNDGGTSSSMRGLQSQTYRINQNPNSSMDRQKHLPYQTLQNVSIANSLTIPANENSCHQSFMQSLFPPHIGEQGSVNQRSISGHQRSQYNTSSSIEFSCPPARDALHLRRDGEGQNRESCDLVMGQVTSRSNSLNIPFSSSSSTGDIQGRNTSPHSSMQKSHSLRPADGQGAKNQLNIQVSINMHGVVHPPLPHQSVSHVNIDPRQTVRPANPPVAQRSRHPLQEEPDSKARQTERNRPGNQRHGNMFDSTLPHLPLAGPSSMILGRQQSVTEKRTGIVRFMPDNPQVSTDNPTPDQHTLTQNFGFPFMPEGTMNPPLNANASFIPPVTQTTATRTPALIPVDPQNTLPSFYPQYSPAHPSLSNDLAIPYFPNQIFPNPSTEKPNSTSLNNRFGSILSPPRPVGFSQTTFPLLPEMPPMHMANPSHLSNFNLTSLFPEIAAALPPDGSAMSPLLSISHSSSSDSSKTSNRPAHNISHILGHDSSSAV